MHKLSRLVDGSWVQHSARPVFSLTPVGDVHRLTTVAPGGDSAPFTKLVLSMAEPYTLLYVLHTPRGEGEPGRYQSPELSAVDFQSFMSRFASFLSSDARFDIWAHSRIDHGTVVWDRHNELFAYGRLDRFVSEMKALGFERGEIEGSAPHAHNYWPELDMDATALLSYWSWSHSPLQAEDEQ
ncbi:hypothetical protein GHT07_19420 [Caenimonas koreensis DSM 17982]|uniref:Uncharacterized protein n=1 Tax=Caenimonas koreensis DSM 17982 TaxID=1121255 RepID=A0A844B3T8_9BURK|nr:hypothetical protein [Caenimonas koreensis]MRD49448.1 hypothetical protein [Caenimonas koreensis DSM 17982]